MNQPHDNTYIGSHDIAAIVGKHPFVSPIKVFMKLMGMGNDLRVNEEMLWGLKQQPVILDEFHSRHCNKEIAHEVHRRYPQKEFLGSTIDGVLIPGSEEGVDAKNVRWFDAKKGWGEEATDQVPEYILIGMQWHMAMDPTMQMVWVAALFSGCSYREYIIRRDDALIEMLIGEAEKFWRDHVLTKKCPEMDASDAASEYLKQAHPSETLPMRVATPEEIRLIQSYQQIHRIAKLIEKREKECENKLKDMIGEAAGLSWENTRFTYKKTRDRSQIDWCSVAHDLRSLAGEKKFQELVKAHTSTKAGYRRFLKTFEEGEQDDDTL